MKILILALLLFTYSNKNIQALPIDWQGEITFDSHYLSNARLIENTADNSNSDVGSYEISNNSTGDNEASFQSYIFKLNPTIIISDSVIIKSEISNGQARGGRLGDDSATNFGNETKPSRYYTNLPSGTNFLNLNQIYAQIYGTTANYVVGRHPVHWGLGAVVNNGQSSKDRFSTIRDGLTAKIKLGKFSIEPFIARSFTGDSLSSLSAQKELGGSLMFHSIESGMRIGVYYSSITTGQNESQRQSDVSDTGTNSSYGEGKLKVTDFYFEKEFNKFSLQVELPIFSGTIGNVFQNGSDTNIDSQAIIGRLTYNHGPKWSLVSTFGRVNGEDGESGTFESFSLHPNFQVSNVMFNYNRSAIWNTQNNVFDSSISNSTFLDVDLVHENNASTWRLGFTYALAIETAKTGSNAFNHSTGKIYTAVADQSDDLGFEIDLDYRYQLTSETSVDLNLAYFSPGDFYAFTNSANENQLESTYLFNVGTTISF